MGPLSERPEVPDAVHVRRIGAGGQPVAMMIDQSLLSRRNSDKQWRESGTEKVATNISADRDLLPAEHWGARKMSAGRVIGFNQPLGGAFR